MKLTRARTAGLVLALAIFLADRAVKLVMTHVLDLQNLHAMHQANGWPADQPDIVLLPFFGFTWTQNFGVSLGMLTATSLEMRVGLIVMTAAIAAGVLVWLLRETKRWDIYALAMVLGGAIGNIWDRISRGYVIDYADLHFGEFRPFMIFNLADAAITFGVLILLARALLLREKPDNTADEAKPSATENA